jgi:hypothetical protein
VAVSGLFVAWCVGNLPRRKDVLAIAGYLLAASVVRDLANDVEAPTRLCELGRERVVRLVQRLRAGIAHVDSDVIPATSDKQADWRKTVLEGIRHKLADREDTRVDQGGQPPAGQGLADDVPSLPRCRFVVRQGRPNGVTVGGVGFGGGNGHIEGLPVDVRFTHDGVPPAGMRWPRQSSHYRRVTDRGRGYDMTVEHMESPAKAEHKQARERQFLPPIWPLVAVVVVIVGIAVWLSH